jgi:hypothetical protein
VQDSETAFGAIIGELGGEGMKAEFGEKVEREKSCSKET